MTSNLLRKWILVVATASLSCLGATPKRPEYTLPGKRPDGSILLPNQWSLRPAGQQLPLGDFPSSIAVHPTGRFVAVLHCGYGQHEIVIVDSLHTKIISRTSIDEAFYGLAFGPDGTHLYCSGAGDEVIHAFRFNRGLLSQHRQIALHPVANRGVPGGIAVSKDGQTLWVANVWGHKITEVQLGPPIRCIEYPLKNATNANPNLIAPSPDSDLAAATKRSNARLDPTQSEDPFPYACVLDERRNKLYVSLWARASIAVFDIATKSWTALWPVEEHPNEMILSSTGDRLFVANANRNSVSIIDPDTGKTHELLTAALYPSSPPGSTPNSLALSPDGTLLFIANACNNNVAVFDVAKTGQSQALGFIPVGWYPTSARVTPDGKHLLVANGKGLTSKSNRHGPQPAKGELPPSIREYIGGLLRGTLSVIPLPARDKLAIQLQAYTAQAYRCSPLLADTAVTGKRPKNNPIPARVGDPSPIKYCLYIIKENRTYDQVLGDMPEGNGDPTLCLFPESITPNHHALAREFVLLDNFYVDGEVSADGHEWTMGAYATDFVEKTWPLSYGHNKHGKFPYPSEGNFHIATPAGGYLWDRAQEAGITYRSYGEFIRNATSNSPASTKLPALVGHFDPEFRGWDLDYPDVKRAERFISELHRFEREGAMPQLQVIRLPNDHTYGTSIGKPSPRAQVGDNDLALGMLVEAVTRSKFWRQTAIFVIEDDAQNGSDHVDAHRSIAFVISPYVRRGTVDSSHYTTCSMLRTIELILGLKPMSQFDAAALPMFNSFQKRPHLAGYRARPVSVDLNEKNLATAWGTGLSKQMDFSKEDSADDLLLNEVIWRSIRGANSPMPPPVRAAFVFSQDDDDD